MGVIFVAMVWHARRRQAALEELRRATERERDFVRDASHELRTPITIARGHTELIRAATDSAQIADDAEIILHELSRLARVAERLLLLAAVEHPGFLRPSLIDIDALLTETERRWSASAPRAWHIHAATGGFVPADGERLSYALDALIENAVKFTRDGGAIAIRAWQAGDAAIIEVRDDGPGVAPEQSDRIFERFAGQASGGTGLGLPIVKAIVEAHGGSITLDSTLGEGASFRIRLTGYRRQAAELRGSVALAAA
jgi:signal transduction histidine kinase